MRKFLYVLGALTLIVIGATGIVLGIVFYKGHDLDSESKAFVDRAIPAIVATWSEQQLLDRATPELRETVKPGELTALFNRLSILSIAVTVHLSVDGAAPCDEGGEWRVSRGWWLRVCRIT